MTNAAEDNHLIIDSKINRRKTVSEHKEDLIRFNYENHRHHETPLTKGEQAEKTFMSKGSISNGHL